jgi:CubicO group peptidase (beta-lactamase class C family)
LQKRRVRLYSILHNPQNPETDVPSLKEKLPNGQLNGTYTDAFSDVVQAFQQNFTEHGEVGASLTLTLNGETVVDLWGGLADAKAETPWEQDTLCVVYSSTKGAVALAAHTLISQGRLDLDQPVSTYWPEFAKNGKQDVTVRMMLNHSAGVPCNREKLRDGGCCDWEYMVEAIENEAPFWPPGTRHGYHMMNFGWTVGELIRRVSGISLGDYFREAIAEPAGAEFYIGLPSELEPKVAPMIANRPEKGLPLGAFTKALLNDAASIQALALFNNGGFSPNSPVCHAAQIGGGGGISNGRGLARIYTPFACGGSWNDHIFVDAASLARMGEVSSASEEDATLLIPTRFALGFMKSMDNRRRQAADKSSVILSGPAFGHVGAGGSIGFADPEAKMGFGYAMNKMGPGILMNERGQSLIDAAYRCLGYQGNSTGVWHR